MGPFPDLEKYAMSGQNPAWRGRIRPSSRRRIVCLDGGRREAAVRGRPEPASPPRRTRVARRAGACGPGPRRRGRRRRGAASRLEPAGAAAALRAGAAGRTGSRGPRGESSHPACRNTAFSTDPSPSRSFSRATTIWLMSWRVCAQALEEVVTTSRPSRSCTGRALAATSAPTTSAQTAASRRARSLGSRRACGRGRARAPDRAAAAAPCARRPAAGRPAGRSPQAGRRHGGQSSRPSRPSPHRGTAGPRSTTRACSSSSGEK